MTKDQIRVYIAFNVTVSEEDAKDLSGILDW